MDFEKWLSADWANADYNLFQDEMEADLNERCAAAGVKVLLFTPNRYQFGAVLSDESEEHFVHLTIRDVRKGNDWYDNVRLRRMSSARDWKGDCFHYVHWTEAPAQAKVVMGPEFDDEAL